VYVCKQGRKNAIRKVSLDAMNKEKLSCGAADSCPQIAINS